MAFTILGHASVAQPDVAYRFVPEPSSDDGAPRDLLDGFLVYYLADSGPADPRLVVRLRSQADGESLAEVFEVPQGEPRVPIVDAALNVTIPDGLLPKIEIRSVGDRWLSQGLPQYDLDVLVRGHVRATMNSKSFFPFVDHDGDLARITVRTGLDGYPLWDLRQIVPEARRRGYARTHYAERKCGPPPNVDLGVSPEWPYVARDGGFFPTRGRLEPPIKVDWERGRITDFSEVVALRGQPCSYGLYSIVQLEPHVLSEANFEAPFSFYDLSGEATEWPNLILRTAYFAAGDPWSVGLSPQLMSGRPVERAYVGVRYSWRGEVGDGLWDYKIEVVGRHAFGHDTSIAGGDYAITAPPYDAYPEWVVDQSWPGVAFVDTEGNSYTSSEGIYDLRPGGVGLPYVLGWTDHYEDLPYTDVRPGFRGEYRVTTSQPPVLYMSPIDSRLHLLHAEHGFWRPDSERVILLEDRRGAGYIDSWVLRKHEDSAGSQHDEGADSHEAQGIEAAVFQFEDVLIHAAHDSLEIRRSDVPPSAFTIAPPHDATSWQAFRERLAPFDAMRRDPSDMAGWLAAFPGESINIFDASASSFSLTNETLSFLLDINGSTRVESDVEGSPFSGLEPGRYIATYLASDREWTILNETRPRLELSLEIAGASVGSPVEARIVIANQGTAAVSGQAEVWAEDEMVQALGELELAGKAIEHRRFSWSPAEAGAFQVGLRIDGEMHPVGTVTVAASQRPSPISLVAATLPSTPGVIVAVGALLLSLGGLLSVVVRR